MLNFTVFSYDLIKEHVDRCLELLKQMPNFQYWTEEHFLLNLPLKFLFSQGAFDKDLLVGFIIASQKEKDLVHIHKYVVDKQYRNRNIGSSLLMNLCVLCLSMQINRISLNVYSDNTKAIEFHKRNGFRIISTRHDKYGELILMEGESRNINIRTKCGDV